MGYQPLEELLPKANNSIYKLVLLAAKRAIELADGKKKLVDLPNTEKVATIALEEIRAGKTVLKETAESNPEILMKPEQEAEAKNEEEPATTEG